MEFEDVGAVGLRVTLLLLTMIFGLPGNIMAMILKARSFKQQGVNAIAYVHLALVDLLLCMFHAPIGIGLELCGYFSLQNDIGYDLRKILFFLNKQVSMRFFTFTSFTSQVTLIVIALFRCWRIFHPFGRSRKSVMIAMLAVPDIITLSFIFFVQQIPSMYYELQLNSTETNSTANQLQSTWTMEGLTQAEEALSGDQHVLNISKGIDNTTELSSGKTITGSHGLLEPIVIYTTLITLLSLTICYSLICLKIQQGYRRLSQGFSESSTKNQAQRNFLSRQVSHVKTQFILILTLMITAIPTLVISVWGITPSFAVLRVRSTVVALGSGINPYVYCLLTAESRRATIHFFTRRKLEPDSAASGTSK